jgi:hypothetical protein
MNEGLILRIGGDISGLRTELNKAKGVIDQFSNQMRQVQGLLIGSFGGQAVFAGLRYGLNVIKDFEKIMSEVRAITNASDEEFQKLTASAQELGRTTAFSAEQVAELQVAFGRLGFSTAEILNSTKATLQLATATGEDLAKSADIAGSTLRAFNLDASEMQRVVDVMAASFNKSALGLDNFGEAIKYVAPVAAAANISLEQTTAMLGVLADAGIRGSMAGTSLRKIISDVGGESGTLTERLQALAAKGFTGADAMDEVGRTAYASLLILAKNVDKVKEAEVAYHNVTGEAKKMADLMADNLAGDINKASKAMDGFILKFGEGSGSLRDFTQSLTTLIQALSNDKVIGMLQRWMSMVFLIPRKTLDLFATVASWFEKMGDGETGAMAGGIAGMNKFAETVTVATAEIKPQVGLIQELEDKLKALEAAKKGAFSVSEIQRYNEKITETSGQLDALKLASTADSTAGTTTAAVGAGYITGDGVLAQFGMLDTASTQIQTAISKIDESMIKSGETIEQWGAKMRLTWEVLQESVIDLSGVIHSALSGIGQALGNAISGGQNLGKALLGVLGGVLVQLGEMLITAGIGVEAFKTSLKSLNGVVAIAAGIALVALGTAISGSMKSMGSNPTGGGYATEAASRSSGNYSARESMEIRIGAEFRIQGNDLVYIYDRNKKLKGRTG